MALIPIPFVLLQVSATVSTLHKPLPAPMLTSVVMLTPVVAASLPSMVHEPALPGPDPRTVVTPLDATGLEITLRGLGLLPQWEHVIEGLRS